jgi:hypothetical protein
MAKFISRIGTQQVDLDILVTLKSLQLVVTESMSISIKWKRGSTTAETPIKLITGKDEEQVWKIDS